MWFWNLFYDTEVKTIGIERHYARKNIFGVDSVPTEGLEPNMSIITFNGRAVHLFMVINYMAW